MKLILYVCFFLSLLVGDVKAHTMLAKTEEEYLRALLAKCTDGDTFSAERHCLTNDIELRLEGLKGKKFKGYSIKESIKECNNFKAAIRDYCYRKIIDGM